MGSKDIVKQSSPRERVRAIDQHVHGLTSNPETKQKNYINEQKPMIPCNDSLHET